MAMPWDCHKESNTLCPSPSARRRIAPQTPITAWRRRAVAIDLTAPFLCLNEEMCRMRCRTLFFAFALSLIFIAGPASAARIIVTIDGLHSAQGSVFVGLYAPPAKFLNGNQSDAMRQARASP